MDERFVKKLIIPSFIIVILSTIFVYELKYFIDELFFKNKHILIIGILSAPENFDQRISIRKTWLQLLSEISGSSYFIIGNQPCEVPVLDRPDPYTCDSQPFVLNANITSQTEVSTINIQFNESDHTTIPNYSGFGFYVRSPIKILRLGILSEVLRVLNCEVKVYLLSAFDKSVLAKVTFYSEIISENYSNVLWKSINPVSLDEHSEAIIRLEGETINNVLLPDCKAAVWVNSFKVISFINLWSSDSFMPQTFSEKSCSYVHMSYTVVDIESIKSTIKSRHFRQKKWLAHMKKLSVMLTNENKIYNDLIFVDVIDAYRNLTKKMIYFYKRIVETEYFHYVLKTDDDSFVDLLRVHNELKRVTDEINKGLNITVNSMPSAVLEAKEKLPKFWWWSSFREFWKVQHSGKWRESQYRSASYPTFPCGGGYVISKGIVDYIANNANNLNCFQGEDVSLGIWLSSLLVTQYKTPKIILDNQNDNAKLQKKVINKFKGKKYWAKFKSQRKTGFAPDMCEWTCKNEKNSTLPLCNKVQMTIKSMYDTWNEYIENGYLL